MVTLTDISALEQARARLAQLSAIVESSDDAIISVTLDGIISSWNNGATRLYGHLAEEAIGRHVSFLSPANRRAEIDAVLSQVREGRGVDRLETFSLRKEGDVVDVSVTYSPIFGVGQCRRRRVGDFARHYSTRARPPGDRRPRRAHSPAPRFNRRSDLRHRSQRRLHLLQCRQCAAPGL